MEGRFTVEHRNDEAILVVSGEVDLANAAALRAAIESLAAGADGRVPVLDLSGLTFIDSSGLHARSSLPATGHRPVLRYPTPLVRRVLDIACPGWFSVEDRASSSRTTDRSAGDGRVGADAVVLETPGMARQIGRPLCLKTRTLRR